MTTEMEERMAAVCATVSESRPLIQEFLDTCILNDMEKWLLQRLIDQSRDLDALTKSILALPPSTD